MSTPRRASFAALALLLGLGLAAVPATALEVWLRRAESGTVVYARHPPDLKYAYAQQGPARDRGWYLDQQPDAPTPGARRIVFVGDSVTYGWKVPERDAWPTQVTSWLNTQSLGLGQGPIEARNFAMTGFDAAQVAAVVEQVAPWEPDLVVWGTYTNDMAPTRLLYRRDGLASYIDPEVPAEIRVLPGDLDQWLQRRSAAWRRLLGARYSRRLLGTTGQGDDLGFYVRNLERIRAHLDALGVPLRVVVLAPHVLGDRSLCTPEHGTSQADCDHNRLRHDQILGAVQSSGVPHVSVLEPLQTRGKAWFGVKTSTDIDHPNPKGHTLFARVALPLLQDALGLPRLAPDQLPAAKKRKKSSRDYPRPDKR